MNLLDHLRRQFVYNAWANREVLTTIKGSGSDNPRALQLTAHIIAAERLWLERIMQKPQSLPVWPDFDFERCEAESTEQARRWREFFDQTSAEDLSRLISYKNSKGEPWDSTVEDILTHVAMHSAYHRGQIASHMRENGKIPAYTDYIHAVRQGLAR
ncbi:MAG TPA: DinB family protein [Candidatus Acidoferrales bacterium]|nr:DinB family protein [Candidatus Acidoferrales bacterium]